MEFTYDEYFRFLDDARDRGYRIGGFDSTPPERGALLLRHDIDLDLDSSVRLAELERFHGVRATYFVLLTSPFYNPTSAAGMDQVRAIASFGHVIGLHFDPTVTGANCDDECARLERIVGRTVASVSFHKPSVELFASNSTLTAPRRHSYEPCFVKDIDYCSDSTGEWRFGPPEGRESYLMGRSLQLLTHAEHWDVEPATRQERRATVLAAMSCSTRTRAAADLGA